MRRDFDLVRKVLLEIESGKSKFLVVSKSEAHIFDVLIEDCLQDEEAKALDYHFRLLQDAGFIDALEVSGYWLTKRITWAGHDFLDSVRDPDIWNQTKEVAQKAKGFSVELLSDIAKSLIKKQIKRLTNVDIEI